MQIRGQPIHVLREIEIAITQFKQHVDIKNRMT